MAPRHLAKSETGDGVLWVEGGWDGDRDGVSEGVQHNTFDVEFYGPNPMCGLYYLGGLRACEEMAQAVGDAGFAAKCRDLFTRGSRWIDANLFNGEYYIQKVQGIPVEKTAKALISRGGAEDPLHPDFQAAEGCLADQLVGQYVAHLAGLGSLVDNGKIRKALESIYRYNYRKNLLDHDSVERIYALNDEAGLLICDYGRAPRPRIPFPYASEVWTGFEYEVATLMILHGMVHEGLEIIENTRLRYDGERRNPWDELECGHHYVRAMAAWSGVLALNGFHYHGARKAVTAIPRAPGARFQSFWSTATGWGTFTRTVREGRVALALTVLGGTLPCQSIALGAASGAASSAKVGSRAVPHTVERSGKQVTVVLGNALTLAEGDSIAVEV